MSRVRQHWQDQDMTTEEAMATMPEEAGPLRLASEATLRRIFGPRRPRAAKRRSTKR